jgi:hypothetical protein
MVSKRWLVGLIFGSAVLVVATSLSLAQTVEPITRTVVTVAELRAALAASNPGDTILLSPGTYTIGSPLLPRSNVNIVGAGIGQTTIQAATTFASPSTNLPDNGTVATTTQGNQYLVNLGTNLAGSTVPSKVDVRFSGITFTGGTVHGGIYGSVCDRLQVVGCEFRDFQWAGIRIFTVRDGIIANNTFVDAGSRFVPTTGSPVTGAGVYLTNGTRTQIYNNRFSVIVVDPENPRRAYGIKGQQGTEVQIYNNTIETDFSIEFPFNVIRRFDIHNNRLAGRVSVPIRGGGNSPNDPGVPIVAGDSCRIFQNYFVGGPSDSVEGPRNGLLVDRNLFRFTVDEDNGNLLTQQAPNLEPLEAVPVAQGPSVFQNNLIENPGRGLLTAGAVQNGYSFSNNHVRMLSGATQAEGLFGFVRPAAATATMAANPGTNLSTITIANNIFDVSGVSRPLLKRPAGVTVFPNANTIMSRNNDLDIAGQPGNDAIEINDFPQDYLNPSTTETRGSVALNFNAGLNLTTGISNFTAVTNPAPPATSSNLRAVATILSVSGQGTGANAASNLFDGVINLDTDLWSFTPVATAPAFPQTVEIDLGRNYRINRTEVHTAFSRAYQFTVEARPENAPNTTRSIPRYAVVVDRRGNGETNGVLDPLGNVYTNQFREFQARFIRLTITGASRRYTGTQTAIREFRIFGR